MWNKKGDLSDVGFGALYQVMLRVSVRVRVRYPMCQGS